MKNEKEELKKFMSGITPLDLTIKQIPETIEGAFLAGMWRADEKYRKAIEKLMRKSKNVTMRETNRTMKIRGWKQSRMANSNSLRFFR